MIGRAYRDKDDMIRARVWQRDDGQWDYEVVKRISSGGWYTALAPAGEKDECFETEDRCRLYVGDWLTTRYGEDLIALKVAELTEGWPGLPPPYETPEGAPEIEPGQIWRRGRQRLVVEHIELGERHGLRVSTRNIESARATICHRRAAAWTYNEDDFRKKFRLECGDTDTGDRERPATKRPRRRASSRR